jgi:hypothetical protein
MKQPHSREDAGARNTKRDSSGTYFAKHRRYIKTKYVKKRKYIYQTGINKNSKILKILNYIIYIYQTGINKNSKILKIINYIKTCTMPDFINV